MSEKNRSDIKFMADPDKLKPLYANHTAINVKKYIWTMDFGYVDQSENGIFLGRFMLAPTHAKILFNTLKKAIETHERDFGKIEDADD